jgi:16S rRNA (cytosine967-C5)-methyltransferase
VLRAVAERDAYANLLLPALLAERGLTGRDAALATELTYGTLRGQGCYDAILAICSDRGLDKIDPPLREVLRLGAHQLLATRVRPHAAVATSVDLARSVAGPRPAGFVNAVLRRVAMRDRAGWLEIAAPARGADPIGYLSVAYSHPRWIVEALRDALGEAGGGLAGTGGGLAGTGGGLAGADPAGGPAGTGGGGLAGTGAAAGLAETEAALAANGMRPGVTLCAVPGLADAAGLLAGGCEPARWSPFGGYLRGGDPARVMAVAEGRAAVQDEASQLAALALYRAGRTGSGGAAGGRGGSLWLDLCAGPGGKARLLAGLAAGRGARLLAADLRPHRARLVLEVIRGRALPGTPDAGAAAVPDATPVPGHTAIRDVTTAPDAAVLGATVAADVGVVVADGTVPAWRDGTFDRVLADVPCSGLGALRRRPEARWRRSPADIAALGPLQRGLLAAALDSARPGGIVAYVTCSPHRAETRVVVADVLAGRTDVTVLDAPAVLAEVPGLRCPDPDGAFAQFWPHRHGTDAIFLALLRRSGPHPAP